MYPLRACLWFLRLPWGVGAPTLQMRDPRPADVTKAGSGPRTSGLKCRALSCHALLHRGKDKSSEKYRRKSKDYCLILGWEDPLKPDRKAGTHRRKDGLIFFPPSLLFWKIATLNDSWLTSTHLLSLCLSHTVFFFLVEVMVSSCGHNGACPPSTLVGISFEQTVFLHDFTAGSYLRRWARTFNHHWIAHP